MTTEDAKIIADAIVTALLERLTAPQPSGPVAAPPDPEYMKVTAFAKASGYSRSTIQVWIKRGMPHIEGGNGARVCVKAAREWIAQGGARKQHEAH